MTESSVRVASAPKTIADVLLPESGEESAMPVIRICDLHLCREPLAQPPTMDTACPHPDAMAVYVAVVRQSKTSLAQPPPSDAATKNQVAVRTPYKSPASSEPPPSLNLQTTKEQSGQDKKIEAAKEPTPDKSSLIVDPSKKATSPIKELAKEPAKEVDATKRPTSDECSLIKDAPSPVSESAKEATEPLHPIEVNKEPAQIEDWLKKDASPISETVKEPVKESAIAESMVTSDGKTKEPTSQETAKPLDKIAFPTAGETKKAQDQTPSLDLQSAKETFLREQEVKLLINSVLR